MEVEFDNDSVSFAVQGMHCEGCERRVRLAMESVNGVLSASADHVSGSVSFTPASSDLIDPVMQAIVAVGYDASSEAEVDLAAKPVESDHHDLRTVYLRIHGMSCASCVRKVETALRSSDGVQSASVNFADETARVATAGDDPDLLAAVAGIGFDAVIVADPGASGSADLEDGRAAFFVSLRRSGLALLAGIVLMAAMIAGLLPSLQVTAFWLPVLLVVASLMAYSGRQFYAGAVAAARYGSATMDTLVALGTLAAFVYSALVVLWPAAIPEASRHLYLDAVLFIIGFINLGKALEQRARTRSASAIRRLMTLRPATARLIRGTEEVRVPVESLVREDLIRLVPGETVPADGIVVAGEGAVDESMLTGESLPVDKSPGDHLAAGTLNHSGAFTIRIEATGAGTVLGQMIAMVREAQNSKPRVGHLADRIAAVFVPVVILIALGTIPFWLMSGLEDAVSLALVAAMSVLVIACPCALGLAVPLSIVVGMGRAASTGILIKDSEVLQSAAGLTTVVLDKTGTLTRGTPEVSRIHVVGGVDRNHLMTVALGLAVNSEHPLAHAIRTWGVSEGLEPATVEGFRAESGMGTRARVDGVDVAMGSAVHMTRMGVSMEALRTPLVGSVVYVAESGRLLGVIELGDVLREESHLAIRGLREAGLTVLMLTGDNRQAASRVAAELGIDYEADLSPADKLARVQKMQRAGERVAMVGDGINDSPALSAADVSFALGHGTDIALDSADVALLNNDLNSLVTCIRLSRRVLANVYQNLGAAFIYNVALIPVAAGVLYPGFGILIHPSLAALAMVASSLTVVTNALRLQWVGSEQ